MRGTNRWYAIVEKFDNEIRHETAFSRLSYLWFLFARYTFMIEYEQLINFKLKNYYTVTSQSKQKTWALRMFQLHIGMTKFLFYNSLETIQRKNKNKKQQKQQQKQTNK